MEKFEILDKFQGYFYMNFMHSDKGRWMIEVILKRKKMVGNTCIFEVETKLSLNQTLGTLRCERDN